MSRENSPEISSGDQVMLQGVWVSEYFVSG